MSKSSSTYRLPPSAIFSVLDESEPKPTNTSSPTLTSALSVISRDPSPSSPTNRSLSTSQDEFSPVTRTSPKEPAPQPMDARSLFTLPPDSMFSAPVPSLPTSRSYSTSSSPPSVTSSRPTAPFSVPTRTSAFSTKTAPPSVIVNLPSPFSPTWVLCCSHQ